MKEEKLQSLFCSFIEHRQRDCVHGVGAAYAGGGDIPDAAYMVEQCYSGPVDDPLPRIPGRDYVLPHVQSFEPPSPLLFGQLASLSPVQLNSVSNTGRTLAQMAETYSSGLGERSNIGFETTCLIEAPEEHTAAITVVRSENCVNQVTKVTWKTCDKTAQSGIHYIGATGELVFNEGETRKTVEIQILKSCEDKAVDLRFRVELDVNGIYNPKPLTVTLKKTDNFYNDEKNVLNSLPKSVPFSVDDIKFALNESLTPRTFHVGLSYLCSTEESVPVQFALAFELGRLCLQKLRQESILHILSDFFRMDDIDF